MANKTMAALTKEQKEYIDLLESRHKMNRVWINFEKDDQGCHPFKSKLNNERGVKFIYENMLYNYIELMKNPEVVDIMNKMLEDKNAKT